MLTKNPMFAYIVPLEHVLEIGPNIFLWRFYLGTVNFSAF
jgi:hypothetical protein